MKTIAFIGLGIMGSPMARNLIVAGYALRLYARKESALEGFAGSQVAICDSPKDAARGADVTIVMVSDTPDVEQVVLADNGVIHGAEETSVVIDMSTISADNTQDIARQLATKNIYMLDAPVSGGEQGAIDGTLSIMVGGNEAAFAKTKPVLDVLGGNITYIGDHGAGQIAKACNQLLVAQTIIAIAEAIEFAQSANVDPHKVREALLGGFAYSKALEIHGLRMLEEDFAPGFKGTLHLKDLKIASANAEAMGLKLEGLRAALTNMQELVARGDGELDSSAMGSVIREKAHQAD